MSKNVKKQKAGTNLVRIEKKEITYNCPQRGKVTEVVEVKIYDIGGKPTVQVCH